MEDLDLRELRYFVAVAEELNFTRAADRLGIAQPPLSRAVQGMETKLGVRLLDRDARPLTLTDAGRVLLEQARPAIAAVAAAGRRAARAGTERPRLAVAVKTGSAPALVRDIAARYDSQGTWPPAEISIGGWGEPTAMLLDGRADVALLRGPLLDPLLDAQLDSEVLLTEPRMAVLPADHPLARRERLRRIDLDGEPVPHWPGATAEQTAYNAATDTWTAHAVHAPPGPRVENMDQMLDAVVYGQGVAFLPASYADSAAHLGLAYVPVSDISPSTVVAAWPQTCRSQAVAAFVRAALEVAQPAEAAKAR
ncbi:LysR family transcriptional regulator [Streptomyces sp. NPDC005492]|uniref:LysR family transcriptional regulator n=1 Tax=Streptomyces sp. NPDC005492 TaxID=3156883 RepID=UPI0033B231F2